MRYCHETRKHRLPEDRIVLRWPVHDLEFQLFSPIIQTVSKEDIECDTLQMYL
jgi:hypothetical protein